MLYCWQIGRWWSPITPVPGGVGAVTAAVPARHVITAAEKEVESVSLKQENNPCQSRVSALSAVGWEVAHGRNTNVCGAGSHPLPLGGQNAPFVAKRKEYFT